MKKRILFVDDEPAILDGLRNLMFRERARWEVVFAIGGEVALAELRARPFDAVVSDMRMPGIDGAALLSTVKREFPDTARVILSGYAEREALARAKDVVDDMLFKPCTAASLRETLERVLAKATP